MKVPDELVEALADGRVVPFVGSGVSLSTKAGFPTWADLVGSFATQLEGGTPHQQTIATAVRALLSFDLFDAAKHAIQGLGKHRFSKSMKEQFEIVQPEDIDLRLPGKCGADTLREVREHRQSTR